MYSFLLKTHSGFRYIVLILLLIAIVQAFAGWFGNTNYPATNRKVNLFTLISAHIQFVLGLMLYFVSPYVKLDNMGSAMKDDGLRYWSVEHITMMIISIVLITIGHSRSKKMAGDVAKHRTIAIFYTLALVIIVVTVVLSGRGLLGMTH